MRTSTKPLAFVGSAVAVLMLAGCMPTPSNEAETVTPSTEVEQLPTPTPAPSETVADVEQDPALAALLETLITAELPPLSLAATGSVPDDCGVDALGCYLPSQSTIYVSEELEDWRLPEILAHEYLHWAWEQNGLESNSELAAALDAAYAEEKGLGSLVPDWQESYVESDGSVRPDDLFAYACTGLEEAQMPDPIAAECKEFLQLDALPVAQALDVNALLDAVDAFRSSEGLQPLERDANATAASVARADLFTPTSQVPLAEFPDSVTQHLDGKCSPASQPTVLTRPSALEGIVARFDETADGALSDASTKGIGFATREFDWIDATEVFGDRTLRVNATLVVMTLCK